MATPSHARSVKSLNTGPGRRRFVFKTFSQRLDGVEIDVYRSLDRITPEPSQGSSFLRDCLVKWRELNTAEDFISYYEQTMPLVQNLPLILLHKDVIVASLLTRLRMDARLSLEPLLQSLTALSRDLLQEFVPYLLRIVEVLVGLLKAGGDREPEIIEQIFYSWSSIILHLQRYLTRSVARVFKVTVKLRYYPKRYVQEFMAKSMSFLLRNASLKEMEERSGDRMNVDEQGRAISGQQNLQLPRGLRKIMLEVAKKPSDNRKFAAASLLFHTVIGTSSKFHSKAGTVLGVLLDKSICGIGDEVSEEPDSVVGVIIAAFERLCEELDCADLDLLWDCLCQEVIDCVNDRSTFHLRRLLTILVSIVRIDDGRKVSDYEPLIKLVMMVVHTFCCDGSTVSSDGLDKLLEVVIKLMIGVVTGLSHDDGHASILASCSEEWAPVFNFQTFSLLDFVRELLLMKSSVFLVFKDNALKVLDNLVESSPEQVLHLFFQLPEKLGSSNTFEGVPGEAISRIRQFSQHAVSYWKTFIRNFKPADDATISVDDTKFASLWGVMRCYHLIFSSQEDAQILIDFVDDLDRLLTSQNENIFGSRKRFWQHLIGVCLSSYKKLKCGAGIGFEDVSKFMEFARKYPLSRLILTAVADYLDAMFGPSVPTRRRGEYHPEFVKSKFVDAADIFNKNLSHPDKAIRVSTLHLLCHYEPMQAIDVLQLLLSIETTPLSVEHSRKVVLSISRIQMEVSAGEVSETHVPTLLYGVIGIFNNRFSYLWEAASECLALLVRKHVGIVWDKFMSFLEEWQSKFLALRDHLKEDEVSLSDQSDFMRDFHDFISPSYDSTPAESVLSLLIQSLQKVPAISEARSRQLVPLFLKFLGYGGVHLSSVGSYDIHSCKGKGWKSVLKEWLNLIKLMRDPKSLYQWQFLKEVLQIRLLEENDPEVQLKVLDCLLNWKCDFLLPYAQNLRNLIGSKTLRNELTTWSLSEESSLIDEGHRAYIVPLVIRILALKVRKSKRNLRRAVLSFIAQLDVKELPLFFASLMKPLNDTHAGSDGVDYSCWFLGTNSSSKFLVSDFLAYIAVDDVSEIYWKKREGFLNVIKDVLGTFDKIHLEPFIDLLMGFVVKMLGFCSCSVNVAKKNKSSTTGKYSFSSQCTFDDANAANQIVTGGVVKHLKKLRSLCLEVVSSVSNRYEEHDFGLEFWDLFFDSVKPLTDNFKEEGSSSEKPSSLFLCFIAMSRSHRVAPRLLREKKLVADIFSMLTITTITEAIVNAVFELTENLLSHYDVKEENAERTVFPNTGEVIHSLHALFLINGPIKRKLVKCPGESLLRIFKLLGPHVRDGFLGKKFLEVLLQFLMKCAHKQDVCAEILGLVKGMVQIVSPECNKDIIRTFSPLLTWVELDLRSSMGDILLSLAPSEDYVPYVGMLVREMNETSIEGLDFDKVLGAYGRINVELFRSVGIEHALLILSQCIYHMSSDELILRDSAYRSLCTFIQFSSQAVRHLMKDGQELPGLPAVQSDDCWTLSSIRHIVGKFLINHMGNAMKRQAPIRKEWFELLRKMVKKLPDVAHLGTFQLLCSKDAEVDFFKNIVHIQKHRRARALMRFKTLMINSSMSKDIIAKVFVPLFFNMLFDAQALEAEKNACIEALASVAGFVDWKTYYALLMRCLHEVAIDPKRQKLILRLICSILDQFHFIEVSPDTQSQDMLTTPEGSIQSGSLSAKSRSFHEFVVPMEIQKSFQKTLLPKIQKLLDSDTDKLNATINLVALKVLKLLPRDVMDSQLPGVIHRISNFLKSRTDSVRDEARLALAACLKELGLEYLQFILNVLRSILKRGFELHVLGYTVNFILFKFLAGPSVGKLDYCLEDLLSIVHQDILGDVSKEKEAEKIASKMKETRKRMSFETLKMIAQNITFRSNAFRLLSPITSHLQNNLTPKLKSNLEEMLRHIAIGVEKNPSVDQNDLFIFIHGIVKDGINGEVVKDASISVPFSKELVDMRKKTSTQGSLKGSPASHLVVGFALSLLNAHLKKLKGAKSDVMLLTMLDPFIALLCHHLSSKYETIIASSISCLTRLVRLPLPSLGAESDKIKDALLNVAHGSTTSSGSHLMESSLKMLTALLSSENVTLSSGNLQTLIKFPVFVDLDRNPSSVAISLLKAIVGCKVVVPEVYDMMNRVGELMVRSPSETIRRKCSEVLLQFLLDYPLSEKRLGQHLDFLLSNLSYVHSTGREAALEMIHAIIMKFPSRVLEKQAQTLFIHMVVSLASDPDNKVRSMTGAAIKRLVGRMGPHSLQSVVRFSLSWYMGEKTQLRSAAAQVMGLLVDVMKEGFQEHIPSVLPVVTVVSKSAVKAISVVQEDSSDEAIPSWKEAYYSLIMLEKILPHFRHLFFEAAFEELWKAVFELLLHPHLWLRNVTARLVTLFFVAVSEAGRVENKRVLANNFLTGSRLFTTAVSCCCQMKTQIPDDTAETVIAENLTFVLCCLNSLMGHMEPAQCSEFWLTVGREEQLLFLEAFRLLGSKEGEVMFLSLTSGSPLRNDEGLSNSSRYFLARCVLKRMGEIALLMEPTQMKIAFHCFQRFASQIVQVDSIQYGYELLLPLYKVSEGFAGRVISDDIKELAQEVSESLKKSLGAEEFMRVYSQLRKDLKSIRDKRKREENVMAVVNPMRNAKRKLRIAAKHRANKKRKLATMKMTKWML